MHCKWIAIAFFSFLNHPESTPCHPTFKTTKQEEAHLHLSSTFSHARHQFLAAVPLPAAVLAIATRSGPFIPDVFNRQTTIALLGNTSQPQA